MEGLTGTARARLYLTAAYTGLRASELGSLTPESFDFAAGVVVVSAGYSKCRRQDTLPLHPALATLLRDWLKDAPAGQPLWPGTWAKDRHAAAMLRVDLAVAKIAYEDASGRTFDFHGLRGLFAASLARAGVHPRVAQLLLRHSKADLTMSVYSHLALVDLRGGLDALPPLPALGTGPEKNDLAATGTDGSPVSACTNS